MSGALDPAMEWFVRRPFAVTAAVASGTTLALVTVHWTGRSIQLVPSASLTRPMEENDLVWPGIIPALELFMAEKGILHVGIRRGVYTGPERASALALQLEVALEDLEQLTTYRIKTGTIAGWMRRRQWRLPLPQRSLSSRDRPLQARGIETASFMVARILQERSTACSRATMQKTAVLEGPLQ